MLRTSSSNFPFHRPFPGNFGTQVLKRNKVGTPLTFRYAQLPLYKPPMFIDVLWFREHFGKPLEVALGQPWSLPNTQNPRKRSMPSFAHAFLCLRQQLHPPAKPAKESEETPCLRTRRARAGACWRSNFRTSGTRSSSTTATVLHSRGRRG